MLKASIQSGRRLDGKGEMEVDPKELWCRGLYRYVGRFCEIEVESHLPRISSDRAGDSTHPTVEDAKIALRQMKDARSLLSSISESLDDAIHGVSKATINDCRSTGLSLLPDDLLTYIFEMYIEMSVLPGGCLDPTYSPHVLASVCRRFREIVLGRPGFWKHVSLEFPRMRLLSLKERCPAPVVHVGVLDERSPLELDNFSFIHPYQQWREFRLRYINKKIRHLYFERLKSLIQTPLESLECLSISNEFEDDEDEDEGPVSNYLDGRDMRTLSSWQMPNLARLELQNVIPTAPLQCGNVTSFYLHMEDHRVETLSMAAFRQLLLSMPKVQSLSIALDISFSFDTSPGTRLSLPSLRSLELEIEGETTPPSTISQIMGLLNTEELTSLVLRFFGDDKYGGERHLFQNFVFAVVTNGFGSRQEGRTPSFARVEDFSLMVRDFRCPPSSLDPLLEAMPNVQNVSMVLPRQTDLFSYETFSGGSALQKLQQLRTLRLELPQSCPDDFTGRIWDIKRFFGDAHCKDLEVFEVQFRRCCKAKWPKAHL